MSVVIIGGNECMERNYRSICSDYRHDAKVLINMVIFFAGAMSHKMLQGAMSELKGQDVIIERCPTSSASALRKVLDKYA